MGGRRKRRMKWPLRPLPERTAQFERLSRGRRFHLPRRPAVTDPQTRIKLQAVTAFPDFIGGTRTGDSTSAPWRRNGVVLRRRLWDLEETKCLLPFRSGIQAGLQGAQEAVLLLNRSLPAVVPFCLLSLLPMGPSVCRAS